MKPHNTSEVVASVKFPRVRSWAELLSDPRVQEVWTEENDGVDYWVLLANGFQCDDCVCVHEWSKRACIDALNHRVTKNPLLNPPMNQKLSQAGRKGGTSGRGQSKVRPLDPERARQMAVKRWQRVKAGVLGPQKPQRNAANGPTSSPDNAALPV